MPQTRMPGAKARARKLGEAGKADLGDGVAEEIGIGRGELGVEHVDDQALAGARGEGAREQGRRAQIDVEMGGPALGGEIADVVMDEERGVVDEQAQRRQARRRRRGSSPAAAGSARSAWTVAALPTSRGQRLGLGPRAMVMDQDVPAVGGERADELGADPLRAAGDDRRAASIGPR